jgi:hypothetical protein
MRIHWIVAILLTSVARTTFAEYWVGIPTARADVRVDGDSIRRSGNSIVYLWKAKFPEGDGIESYEKADCALKSYETISSKTISKFGITSPNEREERAIRYALPNSLGSIIIDLACNTYVDSTYWSPEAITNANRKPVGASTSKIADSADRIVYQVNENKRLTLEVIVGKNKRKTCNLGFDAIEISLPLQSIWFQNIDNGDGIVVRTAFDNAKVKGPYIPIFDSPEGQPIIFADKFDQKRIAFAQSIASKLYDQSNHAHIDVTYQPDAKVTELFVGIAKNSNREYPFDWTDKREFVARNVNVGFNLLWDRARQECGFPELKPQERSPVKPPKGNKKFM